MVTGLIIQAIKFIGKEHINNEYINQLKNHLSDEQIKQLNREAHLAPAWIAKVIKSKIVGE